MSKSTESRPRRTLYHLFEVGTIEVQGERLRIFRWVKVAHILGLTAGLIVADPPVVRPDGAYVRFKVLGNFPSQTLLSLGNGTFRELTPTEANSITDPEDI